ncbi:MAG: hypothetical protein HF981_22740 [Desulfobacteraceae bacterium]|nr:hypothetical protein [Desulfobacteraceae bacterium]MBC2753233.1 hypothetical protein [Desulfobacteraceae bacterium]
MRKQRWTAVWALSTVLLALLGACATPITHPVKMGYSGHSGLAVEQPVAVGIQAFRDQRTEGDRYVIGYRQIGRGERERYVASPDDMARSVTRMAGELIRQKGGTPDVLKGWDYSPEQMLALSDAFDVFVGGDIQQLRCDAEKRLMHTRMVMELEMVVYVGKVREGIVHRRPVRMRSERVAATFGPRELERFLNDMVSEALETGCRDIP